jgi:hypothetical protein
MNSGRFFIKKSILVLIVHTSFLVLNFNAMSQSNPGDFINNYSINKELKVPVRAAIDNNDAVYITDISQKCIIQYDNLWNFARKIFVGEDPTSLAFSDNNTMFVGDYHNGKIYKRLANGTVSLIFADTIFPSSMVVSPTNELYVVDSRSKRVMVLNFAGKVLRTFGSGIFLFPTGIAFDRKNNRVIVSEHGGFGDGFNLHAEIRIFGTSGNLISTFGGWGKTPGKFYRIQGLTVGKCGNIYVTDPYQGNVSVFSENGIYITQFGLWGDTLGKLNVPTDVVFDSRDRVYIVSLNNSALEVFNVNNFLPSSTISTDRSSICDGSSTPVKINFTGTPPWTFTYTIDGANPQTISNTYDNPYILNASLPGAYNVTALSDSANIGTCFTNTGNVILNPLPTSSIANINPFICNGESTNIPVSFTGSPPWSFTYTVNGLNPTAIEDVYTTTYNLIATQAGTYEITALTGDNCAGNVFTGSVLVGLNPQPTSTIITPVTEFCDGNSAEIQIDLTGTAPWTLSYTVNDQNPVTYTNISTNPYHLNAFKPGTYEIAALSDRNCNGTSFTGSSVIKVKPSPIVNLGPDIDICSGQTATLDGGLHESYVWSDNSVNQTLTVSSTGNYSLLATDNDCQNFDEVYVNVVSKPSASFVYNSVDLEVAFTDNSSNGNSHTWYFGDGTTGITANPLHLYPRPGIYIVNLISASQSCGTSIFSDTISLFATSIKDVKSDISVSIYPNPSNGVFNLDIDNPNSSELIISIFNSLGQKVYITELHAIKAFERINLRSMEPGVYSIQLVSGGLIKTTKLVLSE